jgi:predicted RecA/RadA family phage recombinase
MRRRCGAITLVLFGVNLMAQTLSEGEVLNYTATGATANGQLVIANRMAGVALTAATGAGQVIGLGLTGVYNLQAVATGVKTQGLPVGYRTTGTQPFSVTAVAAACTGVAWSAHPTSGVVTYGTRYIIGTVWETATATATTMKVKLHGGPLMALV